MHCNIRVIRSTAPDLEIVGAAAGRRGTELVVLVSASLPHREQTAAIVQVVTDEEWDLIVAARTMTPSRRVAVS